MHKHIKTYNFFTKHNQNSQILKADEEINEVADSYIEYKTKPNTDKIRALYYEICDFRFLIQQIMIVEYGYTIEELNSMFNEKVNRTIEIVQECIRTGQSYDEIRRK